MKKTLILIMLVIVGIIAPSSTFAETLDNPTPEVKQLTALMGKFLKYSNDHNVDAIKKFYAPNYISGDGVKKSELIEMIKDTWSTYTDIKYSSEIKSIRVNKNVAAIESYDDAVSVAGKKSPITGDIGTLKSTSHNIIYLQKFGKDWKIVTDKVNYESTVIKYGTAKNINISFHAPEQVLAGEEYTASLHTEIPERTFALGSITKEPIVHPQAKPEEIFRQVSPETGLLERVLKSNTTNNNELAAASVGFTEIGGTEYGNPELKLTGLAVLLQRVNIIPKSTYVETTNTAGEQDETELEDNTLPDQSDNNSDIKINNDK